MNFSQQLIQIRTEAQKHCIQQPSPHPSFTLFFSVSNRQERATVIHVNAESFDAAWNHGLTKLRRLLDKRKWKEGWLRVDWVTKVEALTWERLNLRLQKTKRNYFRYGLALDASFKHVFLEQEINANAMLYWGGEVAYAQLNEKNFITYGVNRYGSKFTLDYAPETNIYILSTEGLFCDEASNCHFLNGPGLNAGRRDFLPLDNEHVSDLIARSSQYLANQVKQSGEFFYGWHPCFDRKVPTYNTLRHVSATYAMIEAWEVTGDNKLKAAIERSLNYCTESLIRSYTLNDGQTAAYLVDLNDEIKLGGNAVCLLALVKYCVATNTQHYLPLLEKLAIGLTAMQDNGSGRFDHVLNANDLSVKESFRIIYYDGEAAFGLMSLYGLTHDERWLSSVEKAFSYFIAQKHWKAHDHWMSYCVNELTRYKPEEKYFRFGIQNISDHLDFVLQRITTYPTLLELMMAAEQMLSRLIDMPNMQHLLQDIDLDKFYRALDYRAHYLLNGFFWPELAMYFKNPARIVGSFFIRHHAFRVRIDDVEHYLSGYIAYRKFLQKTLRPINPKQDKNICQLSSLNPKGPSVMWGGDVNIGRRQHFRTEQLGINNVFGKVPELNQCDLTIVNLECVITTQGIQGVEKGEGGPYYYRARPDMINILISAGIDIVATANNHSGDYGPEALLEQAKLLNAAGIGHVGSGDNIDTAFSPVYRRAGNINVAVFSIDATMPYFAATDITPGTAYISLKKPKTWLETLQPRITVARQQAHVVLVAVHWEWPPTKTPSKDKIAAGHAIIDAGADAVLGCSGHSLHGIEVYQNKPIIHDAGDLLFDAVSSSLGDSAVFKMEISHSGIERILFIPIGIGFGFSEQITGTHAIDVCNKFAHQCHLLGTNMSVLPEGIGIIDLTPAQRNIINLLPAPATQYKSVTLIKNNPGTYSNWLVDKIPDDAKVTPIEFGAITLLGLRINPVEITERSMIWVETFWSSNIDVIDENIRINILAVPTENTSMPNWGTGMDHDPCDWLIPTTRWQTKYIYRDYYGLRPPQKNLLQNTDLQLHIGIIDKSGQYKNVKLPYFIKININQTNKIPLTPTMPAISQTTNIEDIQKLSVYFFNRSIRESRSGIENATLLRAHIFEKEIGTIPCIATSDYNPRFSDIKKILIKTNKISNNLVFINMYDFFQDAQFYTSQNTINSTYIHQNSEWRTANVPNTNDIRVYDIKNNLIMYQKYADNFYSIEYVNHFKNGKKWRRDTFDSRGFLSRIQFLDDDSKKPVYEQFLRPNGSISLIKSFKIKNNSAKLELIQIISDNGTCSHFFETEEDLLYFWLDTITTDKNKNFIMVLDRSEIYYKAITKIKETKDITVIPMLHATHTEEGLNPTHGKIKNYAARILDNIKKIDALIVLTNKQKQDITQRYGTGKIHVIPHAYPDTISIESDQNNDRFKVVYIARYAMEKNHDAAIDAFSRVIKVIPQATLHFYGHGPEKTAIAQRITSLGLDQFIFTHDFMQDISSIYLSAGLSILTSQREGFSLVVMESLCHGCPVVSFDINYGPSDMIVNGQNGYLVPFGDTDEFANKIICILNNKEKHQQMRKAAISSSSSFSTQKSAELWKNLLQTYIKK